MTLSEVAIIPLGLAVLCIDCQAISNSRGGTCPACGSIAVHNLQQYAQMQKKEGSN